MNATEYFRWVVREVATGNFSAHVTERVLQQWWESEKMVGKPPGEWRDVPVLKEDDTSPRDWPECRCYDHREDDDEGVERRPSCRKRC